MKPPGISDFFVRNNMKRRFVFEKHYPNTCGKFCIFISSICLYASLILFTGCTNSESGEYEVSNSAFLLKVKVLESDIHVVLEEKVIQEILSDGNYIYRAQISGEKDTLFNLENPVITVSDQTLTIRGKIAGLTIEQTYFLPSDKSWVEEHMVIYNDVNARISLSEFETGFPINITEKKEKIKPEYINDRLMAIPFLHRADDKGGVIHDYSMSDILNQAGWEYRPNFCLTKFLHVKSRHHFSDAWVWTQGSRSVGIFSFSQENMIYSVLSPVKTKEGKILRFGGLCFLPIHSQPSAFNRINPGDKLDFGVMRYVSIDGGYNEAAYSYRAMLDEKGCRFPAGYNPPIHWEQLYDMEGAWNNRLMNYSKARVEKEAAKGVEYSCESLYLDPGWDTKFGTFLWGEEWLGQRRKFIEEMKSKYGLKVSLHTPMPPWSTIRGWEMGPNCVVDWPAESIRIPSPESLSDTIRKGPEICMGSEAFMKEAEKRLLANCEDGVSYLMYDGTGWNGPCSDTTHGHPVPYLQEDHMRNCIELVKKVHSKYPDVIIELHDMLDGGNTRRMTPVYYKYGLPLSYDENWGFELMWKPMEDLLEGRGLAMYYYNLSCNVPLYLHIDLRSDNENCIVLWWFASTARHLGIGGTHKDLRTAEAQKSAMKYYKQFDRFFKRGEFYGISEEIHLHVLPEENAFMINMFNLSSETRTITGKFDLNRAGLDPALAYIVSKKWAKVENGILEVKLEMPPMSAEVADIKGVIATEK